MDIQNRKDELWKQVFEVAGRRPVPRDVMDAAICGYSFDEIIRLKTIAQELKSLEGRL